MMFTSPNLDSTTSLDFAETTPGTVVRVGNARRRSAHRLLHRQRRQLVRRDPSLRVSRGGGTVAAAADGSGFVWSPEGAGVHHTTGYGTSWTASTGIPAGRDVESDREEPEEVLRLQGRHVLRQSTDGGATFTAKATGLPAEGSVRFKALPGTEGDIWLAGGASDGCVRALALHRLRRELHQALRAWSRPTASASARRRPGPRTRRVFASAKIGGVRGIFRSTDAGRRPGRGSTTTRTSGAGPARRSPGTRGSTAGCTSPRTAGASRSASPRTPAAGARTRAPAPTPAPIRGAAGGRGLLGDVQGHQPVVRRLPGRGDSSPTPAPPPTTAGSWAGPSPAARGSARCGTPPTSRPVRR